MLIRTFPGDQPRSPVGRSWAQALLSAVATSGERAVSGPNRDGLIDSDKSIRNTDCPELFRTARKT